MADISDYLTNLEETFYQQGLAAGTSHGELHGLFEGRALGKEKAWELWEEVGYYQGVALFWKGVLAATGGGSARTIANLDAITALAADFPLANDSSSLQTAPDGTILAELADPAAANGTAPAPTGAAAGELDIPALLAAIRSKYRAACASLGVRPRMVAAGSSGVGEEGTKVVSLAL